MKDANIIPTLFAWLKNVQNMSSLCSKKKKHEFSLSLSNDTFRYKLKTFVFIPAHGNLNNTSTRNNYSQSSVYIIFLTPTISVK